MPVVKHSLHFKITGILLIYFVIAFAAIGVTLFTSWQLKGAAAAINDAGSLRMGMYRMAYLTGQVHSGALSPGQYRERLTQELARQQHILDVLDRGDPQRPLFAPGGRDVDESIEGIRTHWTQTLKPRFDHVLGNTQSVDFADTVIWFERQADDMVAQLDAFVSQMERSYTRDTTLLRASQILLVVMAIIGTVFLLRFFAVQVVRPIGALRNGVENMAHEDFNTRVPVERDDELGELAGGFNRMAAHLQDLYRTLEQRVQEKTENLSAKNRELEILYSMMSFLHEPHDMDSLCHDFLRRIRETMGATACSIRLMDQKDENLCISYCEGLDETFLDRETVISCTDCLCGSAAEKRITLFADTTEAQAPLELDTCRKAGFRAVTASTISINKRAIGIFNLFFDTRDKLDESDQMLLTTLGEQLGTAIDSLRLQSRERDLAVSEERNLLARELHDSIAQSLAFINLQTQLCQQALKREDIKEAEQVLGLIHQGVQESYDDVRELLVHFRARVGQGDLETAIEAALSRLDEQTGVQTTFESLGGGAPLDADAENQLLYIVQEALSNVRKHARAHSVQVHLRRGLDGVSIRVRDDGVGFDDSPQDADASSSHIGLQVMHERAQRIGARLRIHSTLGRGTEVKVDLARRMPQPGQEGLT